MNVIWLFVVGAIGALVKDIVTDNKIQLPKKTNSEILLGTLGAMIIGGFVGWAVDQSLLVAGLSGFVGITAIEHLLPKRT